MKTHITIFFLLALLFSFSGCDDDDISNGTAPVIQIEASNTTFDGLNVGDKISIPVEVNSTNGIRRLSYFFIMENANGTETSEAVNYDDPSFPSSVSTTIEFDVVPKMIELVIVAFDKFNSNSEEHITMSDIRGLPQLNFTGNVDYRETVFENKMLEISGHVSSEFDLESMSYSTIKNDQASEEQAVNFSDAKEADFSFGVLVEKDLQGVIVKATNIYDGQVVDTFNIGSVADDAVAITMQNGISEIEKLYTNKATAVSGIISSGSDVRSFSYAIKNDGSYGGEVEIALGSPLDEFNFSVDITAQAGTEAIRFTGINENGDELKLELPVNKVLFPLVYRQDVELTTEIGAGKPNWFSAYQAPYIFDQTTAVNHQDMMDFVVVLYSGTSLRFLSAAVYESASYLPKVAPYMEGFTQATYAVTSSNRPSITSESFGELEYDEDLDNFIDNKIVASSADGGENYNVKGTNRRTSANLEANSGLVIGWGSYVDGTAANEEFAVIYIKEITIENGVGHVKFDIKYPQTDYRTIYNPVSILTYP